MISNNYNINKDKSGIQSEFGSLFSLLFPLFFPLFFIKNIFFHQYFILNKKMPKAKTNKIENIPNETSDYPKTNSISYSDGRRSYHYKVKQEGLYLQPPVLAYTKRNNYKIPDNYCVETTWGRGKKKTTVRCFINY